MSEDLILKCLIAFILGWFLSRKMGDGFRVGAKCKYEAGTCKNNSDCCPCTQIGHCSSCGRDGKCKCEWGFCEGGYNPG